jgi:enoyl-CoA hydratase/carnithine racemase
MLDLIRHDAIHELRLARPPVNALDLALVRALRAAVEAAPGDGARALVLSGAPGLFSAGLDLPALLQLDRDALHAFMVDFFGLCGALACAPVPIVSAITGHSPAGGAVLAIMGDYRVMARSVDAARPFRIGLNEVQVGLPVPEPIQFALRRLIGIYRAERLLTAGAMVEAERALALGFVDELAEPERVVARALEWAREWLELPEHAARETRRLARADLAAALSDPEKLPVATFVADWFAPEVQARLHAVVEQLRSKAKR